MSQNEDELRLRVTETGSDQVANKLKQLTNAETKLTDASKAQTTAYKAERQSLLDLERGYEQTKRRLDEYAAAKAKAAKADEPSGGDKSSSSGGTNGLERGLNSAAALAGSGPLSQGIRLVSDFAGAVGDMNPVILASTVAIGAVTTVLNALKDSADRAGKGEQERFAEIDKHTSENIAIRQKVATETKAQLATEFDNLYSELSLRQLELKGARDRKAAIDAEYAALGSQLNIDQRASLGERGLEAQKEIDRLTGVVGGLQSNLSVVTGAMQDTGLATKEAAQAELELAAARAASSVKSDQSRIAAQIEAANLAATGTEEQVQARLDALAREKQVLQDNLPILQKELDSTKAGTKEHEAYQQQLNSVHDRLSVLDTTMMTLAGDTLQAAKANDAKTASEKTQADALKEVDKANADLADVIAKRTADVNAERQKEIDGLTDLKSAFDQAGLDIAAQRMADAAKLTRERADEDFADKQKLEADLQKADQEAARAEIDAHIKHRQALEQIDARYNRSSANAIQDRNAVALQAAKDQKADETQAANSAEQEDIRTARANAKRRQEDLRADFVQQQRITAQARAAADRERVIAYQFEDKQRQDKYTRDQQKLHDSIAQETAQKQAGYNKQLTDLSKFLNDRSQTEQGYFGAILSYAKSVKDAINATLNGGNAAVMNGAVSASKGGNIISFDGGGRVGRTGIAKVHEGELILTPKQQQSSLGGFTFNIKGVGPEAVKKEVSEFIDRMYQEYDRM